MNIYMKKFAELKKSMESNDQVKIDKIGFNTEVDEETTSYIIEAFSEVGFALPENFAQLLDASRQCELRFSYSLGEGLTGSGEFNIYPVDAVLESRKDPKLPVAKEHSKDAEMVKHFRIIDDHPISGDFKLAAFYMKPGYAPPNFPDIYFYDRGKFYRMDISYGDYLLALGDLAGITNWQYLFCEIDRKDAYFDPYFKELKQSMRGLKEILPGSDLTRYEKLLHT